MVLIVSAFFAGCEAEIPFAPESVESEESVIYGRDDRREYYDILSAGARDYVSGIAVMVSNGAISQRQNGTWDLDTSTTLGDYFGLCNGEPFANQPAPGECSAFLVGPDTIATAGHCISNADCGRKAFVFDFVMTAPNTLQSNVGNDDVYFCDNVIARSTGNSDWALVQLDRPVVGHTILPVRQQGKIANNAQVTLVGFPGGIPLKFASGAIVKGNSAGAYFSANMDAYGGNSGSAVLNNTTGVVEGILVRGNNDYNWTGRCYESNVCSNVNGCPGFEDATRATEFASFIP